MEETDTAGRSPRLGLTRQPYRPPYGAAAMVTLAVWGLYLVTLAPTTQFWDTSEYIATAHILGIPHPPGNPLFVVLARSFDILLSPLGLPIAVRINLFSATMGALAHGCWFLLVHRILAFYSENRLFRLLGAVAAVVISATAFTVWNQSNVNEKVYTVSLFTIALLSWLAFRWRDHLGEGKDDNIILLMIFILALSVGNHLMALLVGPAVVLFILLVEPRTLINWRLYATGIPAALLGLSIYLFLPIRANLNPVINEADPTCASLGEAFVSVLTLGKAGCPNLSAALARRQYDKPSVFVNPTDTSLPRSASMFAAQMANYAQYFDWQWARSVAGQRSWFGGLRPLFTLLFLTLGMIGLWSHYDRDRVSWAYLAVLFATLSLGLVFYLNFKYGFTYPLQSAFSDAREVRERDYFFIGSFSVWGLWSGMGLATVWQVVADRLVRRRGGNRQTTLRSATPVMALAFLPLIFNWSWASRAHDHTARDWAYNLLMSVEPYGILFTNGDNDTFPLWYLQEVEGIRKDVTVMVMSYLNTPWYVRQIKGLTTPCPPGVSPDQDPTRIICQRPFRDPAGVDLYADLAHDSTAAPGHHPPRKTIVPLTDAQIDQYANTPPWLLQSAQVFKADRLETTLPKNSVMIPADMFQAAMIRQSLTDRPVFYAMTTQAYQELNLHDFLVRQGVAFRLNDGPVVPDSATGIFAVPQTQLADLVGPYIDLPLTDTLLSHVFVHSAGIPEHWNRWVDVATEGIPHYYGYSEYGLALVYEMLGNRDAAERHADKAEAWLRLGNLRRQTQ